MRQERERGPDMTRSCWRQESVFMWGMNKCPRQEPSLRQLRLSPSWYFFNIFIFFFIFFYFPATMAYTYCKVTSLRDRSESSLVCNSCPRAGPARAYEPEEFERNSPLHLLPPPPSLPATQRLTCSVFFFFFFSFL